MNDKKLTNYLDKNFERLIKKNSELIAPAKFFSEKWENCEEIPFYCYYSQISFLNRFSQEEKDLYLLKYSLKHLNTLVDYFCKTRGIEEISNALIMLTISDWDLYPEEQLSFSFFITYNYHAPFVPSGSFVPPYTKQSFYIIKLLEKLGIVDEYLEYDDKLPINVELQRVRIGFKKHLDPNLITLDHFVEDSREAINSLIKKAKEKNLKQQEKQNKKPT